MKKEKRAKKKVKTWRDLSAAKAAEEKVMSKTFWPRLYRWALYGAGTVAVIIGLILLVNKWLPQLSDTELSTSLQSVERIRFQSDGILDEAWLNQHLALPEGQGLMTLDRAEAHRRLMSEPRVREAYLEIQFPGTLIVEINERTPAFILKVRSSPDEKLVFVDAEGILFEPLPGELERKKNFPFLTGITLQKSGGKYRRIPEVPLLYSFWETARKRIPELANQWKIISGDRLIRSGESFDGLIEVKTVDVDQIFFHCDQDFAQQFKNLDEIMAYSYGNDHSRIKLINLSLGDRAVVQYDNEVKGPGKFRR